MFLNPRLKQVKRKCFLFNFFFSLKVYFPPKCAFSYNIRKFWPKKKWDSEWIIHSHYKWWMKNKNIIWSLILFSIALLLILIVIFNIFFTCLWEVKFLFLFPANEKIVNICWKKGFQQQKFWRGEFWSMSTQD